MQRNLMLRDSNSADAEGIVWPAVSGLVTAVAAGADLGGFVNLDDRPFVVAGIRIRWVTTTAFASAQALAFRVNKVYGFTAIHSSGGTAVQAHHQYQAGIGGSSVGDRIALTSLSGYIAATGAISGASYTAEDTDEPEVFAVGAGSTLPGVYEDWYPPIPPMVLVKNTGLVLNNQILMGSSGVGNLYWAVDGYRQG